MKRFLILLLTLAAVACGDAVDTGDPNDVSGSTFRVRRAPLRITLTEKGTLAAKNSVKIRPTIKNSAKVEWLIDNGTEVQAGDVLIALDKSGYEKEVEDLEDQILQLEADVKNAQTEVEIQRSDNASSIDKAKFEVESADADLKKYREGDEKQERYKRALVLETRMEELERERKNAEKTPELLEEGFITPAEADLEAFEIKKLEGEVESAKLELELWERFTNPMEKKRLENRAAEAKRDLARASQLAESRLESKMVVLRKAERRLGIAREKLVETRTEIEKMTIVAPAPGIVVYETDRRGDDELKVGDTAYRGRTLMTLPDLAEMEVSIEVHEADITKLEVGQKATITLDSYRDMILSGEVVEIAQVGSSRGRWDSTKKFAVTISIDKRDLGLRPGVTAKTEILVDEISDVIAVPIQAVFASDGRFYAWRRNGDDEPERRTLKPGRSNDNFVEIVEGLSEGDEILLYQPEGAGRGGGEETPPAEGSDEGGATSPGSAGGGRGGSRGGRGGRG